jgi:release factor glutamine methyltransferase
LQIDRVQLFLRYDQALDEEPLRQFQALVRRRAAGEPIAYVVGRRGFRTIELVVDERVLVPRPETERFVDHALAWLAAHPGPRRVVDVGTGSGAIALALASELPRGRLVEVDIVASDVSRDALAVAALNRERLWLEAHVRLVASDLLAAFRGPFNVILANLPYLRPDQVHHGIACEPAMALYGGADGFALYRRLLRDVAVRGLLASDGLLVGEIDPAQAGGAVTFARELTGRPARIDRDFAGDARYLVVGTMT